MTRISSCVKPSELCNQMLLAEHREIIRIPNCIISGKAKVILKDIPENYKLGSGHVKFFYNKIGYLHGRYNELYKECLNRGFNIKNYTLVFTKVPDELYNEWEPNYDLMRPIIVERINDRLSNMKKINYFDKSVTADQMKLI